jgi:hypothetical protein
MTEGVCRTARKGVLEVRTSIGDDNWRERGRVLKRLLRSGQPDARQPLPIAEAACNDPNLAAFVSR